MQKKTEEFANGNTFVRLQSSVMGATLNLYLPQRILANDLMEALITVFIAKKMGAQEIIIASEGAQKIVITGLNDMTLSVDPEKWFQTAGANSWKQAEALKRNIKKFSAARSDLFQEIFLFSDSEKKMQQFAETSNLERLPSLTKKAIKGSKILFLSSLSQQVNFDFFKTLARIDQLRRLGASQVDLITPYLPYARSDKVDQVGVAVTGRLIANLIESSGANAIFFVRAHAPQSEGFFNIPTKNVSGRETLNAYLQEKEIEIVVSPDAGFQKDATLYADELKVPVAVINNQRDPLTGQTRIFGISGPDVRGKKVVIVDDETASGSTLAKAAEYLKSLGAKSVFAAVTHLTGSAQAALDSQALAEIIVTDTVPVSIHHEKLKVLSADLEIFKSLSIKTRVNQCKALFIN